MEGHHETLTTLVGERGLWKRIVTLAFKKFMFKNGPWLDLKHFERAFSQP